MYSFILLRHTFHLLVQLLYTIFHLFFMKNVFFVCAKCACFCAKCAKYFCLCAMPLCFFVFAYLGASRCVTPLQEPAAPGLCHHLGGYFIGLVPLLLFFLFLRNAPSIFCICDCCFCFRAMSAIFLCSCANCAKYFLFAHKSLKKIL